MDIQTAFNVVLGLVLAGVGWFGRALWEAVKELRSDLSKLREEIPQHYVSKSDFKDSIKELKELLERIDNKLDRKQDK